MRLKRLELSGFKSFSKKTALIFDTPITAIVGPNGSGKSNVAEAFRWVLGEQSLKSLRGKRGEDLIFNGGESGGRSGKASVTVTFDNTDQTFGVDFEEVVLTRTVHRDGVNDYELNGSKVRLRDILELLAKVSLGSSGHTIVSQGDADRILLANVAERKAMVEESLGLKIYQWKLVESERKLEKTEENIKQVESLRREIAPHLKFLKKQVEKIERADELRRDLKTLYREYLAREAYYLLITKEELAVRGGKPRVELLELEDKLKKAEALSRGEAAGRKENEEIAIRERELSRFRSERDNLSRTLGRLEGILQVKAELTTEADQSWPVAHVTAEFKKIDDELAKLEGVENLTEIKAIIKTVRSGINNFLSRRLEDGESSAGEVPKLKAEQERLRVALSGLEEREKILTKELTELKKLLDHQKEESQGALRALYELRARRTELKAGLETVALAEERLRAEETDLKRELEEGVVLVDQEVKSFADVTTGKKFGPEERSEQEKRRKEIERLKIRLEDMGMEGTDVMHEYQQATERDEYLAKELLDLAEAKSSLLTVMADLKDKLEAEFTQGLKKINEQFSHYFSLMFGGGTARLDLLIPEKRRRNELALEPEEIEEPEQKPGIDIYVSLPRKKIRGLQMLSGGERALTSIALLFAIAAVNPPPFLILDETDAALDEANSRKYGEMIATLAESSQLILITHNRETMSRAGVLYGVTMGSDGVSKLLSVRFEEAASFAK